MSGDRPTREKNHSGLIHSYSDNISDIPNELWQLANHEGCLSQEKIQELFINHCVSTLARSRYNVDKFAAYQAASLCVRDVLIKRWNATQQFHTKIDAKRVYYLSLEFLLGRSLDNTLLNLGHKTLYQDALSGLGFRLEDLANEETDPALGNGGLGRLAACFMDSLATLNYPAWGYGIRYNYGMFRQKIIDGYQVEKPDYWLNFDNPWEVPRHDINYSIQFYGNVEKIVDENGDTCHRWCGGECVRAVAYDVPIAGYNTPTTINLRLWSAKPLQRFDLQSFNEGNYIKSIDHQLAAETITNVLYPNDCTSIGKELRLKQQYFFVSATIQDIVRRFKKTGKAWSEFSHSACIQLNDTHPSLAIPEFLRILIDVEKQDWYTSWQTVSSVFNYTNHTVLPEALERWPVSLMHRLLPRHMQIIFDLNLHFLMQLEQKFPDSVDMLKELSIIEEGAAKHVRMGHLAVIGSNKVNGVAAVHTEIIKSTLFKGFVNFYGDGKFVNITNGISPRRWMHVSNPVLSALITDRLGTAAWLTDLQLLSKLEHFAADADFQKQWREIKLVNKKKLADYVEDTLDINLDPSWLFDAQVKRFHEYKRQLLNILGIAYRYILLSKKSDDELAGVVKKVCIFAGKAAPGYDVAKLTIKLVNMLSTFVNENERTNQYLKVVFIPDYNVSTAEMIIPACDVSQHISTAGMEASGTSNMKFGLNGALLLGTWDGANVEIFDTVGVDNFFSFGARAGEVEKVRFAQMYRNVSYGLSGVSLNSGNVSPTVADAINNDAQDAGCLNNNAQGVGGGMNVMQAAPSATIRHRHNNSNNPGYNPKIKEVIDLLKSGAFGNYAVISALIDTIHPSKDTFLINHDFDSYIDACDRIDSAWRNETEWTKASILNTARISRFSSDRAVREYADEIWNIKEVEIPYEINNV